MRLRRLPPPKGGSAIQAEPPLEYEEYTVRFKTSDNTTTRRCCPGSPQAGGPFSSAMALSSGSPQAGGPQDSALAEETVNAVGIAILSEVNDLYF